MKLQHKEINTFLMRKLSVFLSDNTIMYMPKDPQDIMRALKGCSRDPYMKFSVQEIGIYEKMIEQLKPLDASDEERIKIAYDFVMENSAPIPGCLGL